MRIAGLQKTTLLDYPGKIAATVFCAGCNFRCPFCHNASVVFDNAEHLTAESVLSFLDKRKGILDGVCVTGGEPLLSRELPSFLEEIKKRGFLVKLDTNGSSPEKLKSLMVSGLVDYVAMDIKNAPARYAETCGVTILDVSDIFRSAELLMQGSVDFEFRTTVAVPLHEESDFEAIGQWLAGEEKYFLQAFQDSGDLIGEGMQTPAREQMEQFLSVLRQYVPRAAIRGE